MIICRSFAESHWRGRIRGGTKEIWRSGEKYSRCVLYRRETALILYCDEKLL